MINRNFPIVPNKRTVLNERLDVRVDPSICRVDRFEWLGEEGFHILSMPGQKAIFDEASLAKVRDASVPILDRERMFPAEYAMFLLFSEGELSDEDENRMSMELDPRVDGRIEEGFVIEHKSRYSTSEHDILLDPEYDRIDYFTTGGFGVIKEEVADGLVIMHFAFQDEVIDLGSRGIPVIDRISIFQSEYDAAVAPHLN